MNLHPFVEVAVELCLAVFVPLAFLTAWRLEALIDRVAVLERLAHPPATRAPCPKCARRPAGAATTTHPEGATDART